MFETMSPRSRLTTALVGREILDLTLEGDDEVVVGETSRRPMKSLGPHDTNKQPRTDGGRQLNLDKILTRFKLGTEKLRLIFASVGNVLYAQLAYPFFRKKQYQILYFPMERPLTTAEKMERMVVTSTKYGGVVPVVQ